MENSGKIIVYTDGGCHGNPGPGGWACVIIAEGEARQLSGGKVHSGYYDSEFDSSSLEEIALAGGGTYFGIESTAAFAEALNSVSRKQNVLQTFHYKSSNRQLYSYFLIFSAIVFFAAWFIRRILLKEI